MRVQINYSSTKGNSIGELTRLLVRDLRLHGHNVTTAFNQDKSKFDYVGANSWFPWSREEIECTIHMSLFTLPNAEEESKTILIIDDTRWRTIRTKLAEYYSISDFSARALQRNLKVPVYPLTFRYDYVPPRQILKPLPPMLPQTLYTNIIGKYMPENVDIYLNISQVLPRKNLHIIAQAFAQTFRNSGDKLLWFHIGEKHWVNDEYYKDFIGLLQTIYSEPSAPYIIVTAFEAGPLWIDRLIANSVAYISAHAMEGLGLPMLRALSLGTPVIAPVYAGPEEFLVPNRNCIPVSFETRDSAEFNTKIAIVTMDSMAKALRRNLIVPSAPRGTCNLTKRLGLSTRMLKDGYTVLVPFAGKREVIEPLFDSLERHEKVVVAYQGEEKLIAPPNVKIVNCAFKNISMARNVCMQHVSTEQFIFLDGDISFKKGTLAHWHKLHLEVCAADSDIQITTPLQLHPSTGNVITAHSPFGYDRPPSCREYVSGRVYNARGAAMMCNTRTCLIPYDEIYSFFYDETDWLLHLMFLYYGHFKMHYLSEITLFHNEGSYARTLPSGREIYHTNVIKCITKFESYLPPDYPASTEFDVPLINEILREKELLAR